MIFSTFADGRKTIRLRGTSEQVAMAKRMVDERLSQCALLDAQIQSTLEERQPRAQIKYRQPLFLKSEESEEMGPLLSSASSAKRLTRGCRCARGTRPSWSWSPR